MCRLRVELSTGLLAESTLLLFWAGRGMKASPKDRGCLECRLDDVAVKGTGLALWTPGATGWVRHWAGGCP